MGLKAAIQALKKADILKVKVQNSKDLLNDNEAWICQQQLQRIYQQVLILDLEYALDRKVEQELWNHGFKNYIGTLQNLIKDIQNPKRTESQAMLSWCLEAASGFYLTLLQEICTTFDLDLPFRRKGSVYGNGKQWRTTDSVTQPHKSSCYYICQHCLVHLGDIARYRNQNRQAEVFYRHAVQLSPSSGQPYNQLALLEASRGDKLSTVFHYVRSVAVRHPFPAAATNLSRTLEKSAEEMVPGKDCTKLSGSEYVCVYLRLHGLLHATRDLSLAEQSVRLLGTSLTAHIATEALTSWKLVQMLAINLFSLHQVGHILPDQPATLPDNQLCPEELRVKGMSLDLLAGSLSACLLPIYTLKEGDSLLEYFALPAIKLTLDWIRLDPKVLLEPSFTTRLHIWPALCKLLNILESLLSDFPADKYSYIPLPEDRDLQGFIPLEKAFTDLRFSCEDWKLDPVVLNKLRASRLLEFGVWLASHSSHLFTRRLSGGLATFEVVGGQPAPSSDLIRELEELSLTKLPSPSPSDSSSWGTGASTPDNLPVPTPVENGHEKRAGILKPQGSLEKAREAAESVWGQGPARRGRQNVAMQAIMRKSALTGLDTMDNLEVKQSKVTFKTPSPNLSPGTSKHGIAEDHSNKPTKPATWSHGRQQNQSHMKQSYLEQHSQHTPHYPYQTPEQQTLFSPSPREVSSPSSQTSPDSTLFSPLILGRQLVNLSNLPLNAPSVSDNLGGFYQSRVKPSYSPWREEPSMPRPSWWGSTDIGSQWKGDSHASVFSPGFRETPPQSSMPNLSDTTNTTMFSSGDGPFTPSVPLGGASTYSLFSSPSWTGPLPAYVGGNIPASGSNTGTVSMGANHSLLIGQQSLWSGPGPSPLERLLEQQKQLREGPAPKGGT